jgi:hypothetical protein
MGSSNKLSPMAGYYVRRLIQSQKASLLTHMEHASISEAMLQEPEVLLHHLVTNPSERLQRLNTLEILARAYQQLVTDGQHPEQLINVEKQLMMALGFSDAAALSAAQNSAVTSASSAHTSQNALTIAKTVEIMEDLVKCGERYLGPKLAREYCMGSCPESLKLNGFTFQDDHRLKISRPMTDILQGNEAEDFKTWIKQYIRRCSTIIGGFDSLANQQHLAFCGISRQGK